VDDLGDLLQEQIDALVGVEATWIVQEAPPTFEEALEENTNAELADAEGLTGGPVGSAAWTARRSFMRSLQRYRNYLAGTGRESRNAPPRARLHVAGLGRRIRERSTTPQTPGALWRLIRAHGVTVTLLAGVIVISSDRSYREVRNVFCRPSDLRGRFLNDLDVAIRYDNPTAWLVAGEELIRVWRVSYGVPGFTLDEIDVLELAVGRQPGQAGGHRMRGVA
jgi:hypothetical protein